MKATLLDTCSLIWWTVDPSALSNTGRDVCAKMEQYGTFISSVSVWEIGVKIKNRKLDIGMPIDEFARKLKEISFLTILPVDIDTWVESLALNWAHKDPADRIIVASARLNGLQILTNDKIITDFYKYTVG